MDGRWSLKHFQVEYLVVNYKDDDEKVTLSLRQADILTALAQDEELRTNGGCVPALQDVTNTKWVYQIKLREIANNPKG